MSAKIFLQLVFLASTQFTAVEEAASSMLSMCLGNLLSKLVLQPKSGRPPLFRGIWTLSGIASRDYAQNFTQ